MITTAAILYNIDLLWIPVALATMERGKRLKTCAFILGCWLLLRLQVELLREIGMEEGFFGLMDSPVFTRGLITYSVFIFLFLVMAFFSKGADKHVHLAASISMMIAAFCVSTLVMVL